MADVSKRRRTFEVWLDVQVVGKDPTIETVIVDGGADADEVCGAVLETMIANEVDSGWGQVRKSKKAPVRP